MIFRFRKIYLSLCCCLFFVLSGCQKHPLYKDTRVMMGTFIEVASPSKEASQIVFAEFNRLEKLLSKYIPESEVSRLNREGEISASPETFYIIKRSKEFWRKTSGAFDISVGPLVNLWGFTDKKYRLPNAEEIKAALQLVGSDKIILREKDNVIEFMLSGMSIDLGAIAKGYALDCSVAKLKEHGISSCLINAGGQVYGLGDNLGKPWRVAINNTRGKPFSGYLSLRNQSVSTSADSEQYFAKEGRRYGHIIDPKTGYPAQSTIAQVTVAAPDGLTADALSTAVFVLGKDKAKALEKKFPRTVIKIYE